MGSGIDSSVYYFIDGWVCFNGANRGDDERDARYGEFLMMEALNKAGLEGVD